MTKLMFLSSSGMRLCMRRPASRFASPEIHYTQPVPKKLSTRHLGRACLLPIGRCQTASTHLSSITHTPLHISHSQSRISGRAKQASETNTPIRPPALRPSKCVACEKQYALHLEPNFATTVEARSMHPYSPESHYCAVCTSFHFAKVCNSSSCHSRRSCRDRRDRCDEAEVEFRICVRDGLEERASLATYLIPKAEMMLTRHTPRQPRLT